MFVQAQQSILRNLDEENHWREELEPSFGIFPY